MNEGGLGHITLVMSRGTRSRHGTPTDTTPAALLAAGEATSVIMHPTLTNHTHVTDIVARTECLLSFCQ